MLFETSERVGAARVLLLERTRTLSEGMAANIRPHSS
jgi:hypothetical protein